MYNYAIIITALLIFFIILYLFNKYEYYTGSPYLGNYALMGDYSMQGPNPMMSTKYPSKYKATLMLNWSGNPQINAPSNPHTGNMFYVVQNGNLSLFQVGQLASKGISITAMFGTVDDLQAETRANPNILKTYTSPVLNENQKKQSIMLDLTPSFNSISFVTMISPSPDWFIGIPNMSLMKNGKWIDDITIPLYVYDAGTDKGMEFANVPDYPEKSAKPIEMIRGEPFYSSGNVIPIAFMNLKRVG